MQDADLRLSRGRDRPACSAVRLALSRVPSPRRSSGRASAPFAELLAGAEADLLAVGMILAEQDDQWQDGRRLLPARTMAADRPGSAAAIWRACALWSTRESRTAHQRPRSPATVLPMLPLSWSLRAFGTWTIRPHVVENPEALGDRMFTKQRPHEYEHEVRALGYLTDRVPERV